MQTVLVCFFFDKGGFLGFRLLSTIGRCCAYLNFHPRSFILKLEAGILKVLEISK